MAKLKSTTTQDIPQTNETIIHHHAPSYAGAIITAVLAAICLVWLAQYWLISLLDALHFSDPEAAFAGIMVFVVIGIPLLILANWIMRGWAEAGHQHKLELEDRYIDRLTIMHQMQQSVVADSRELDPDTKRRNALIVALVADGLQGRHNFSFRKAGKYILTNEDKPVGKDATVTRDALEWLKEKGAISNNKLTDRYTSIAQVQRDLHAPIIQK